MDQKFKFRFYSSALSTYLIISGLGFCVLLFILWNVTVKMDKNANLERDINFISNGIKTSILESTELSSEGLGFQSHSLLQRHLDYTFEKSQIHSSQDQFFKVTIYFLNPERQMIAEWVNSKNFAKECLNHSDEYFEPENSDALYVIELTTNTCSQHALGFFDYHVLSAPILVAFCIVGLWGICIYMMFDSVSYAGKLLGSHENTDELIEGARKIRWRNVATLTQKALTVRGKNLQYYQTLILDAQHDIAKIIDFINKKYNIKGLNQDISMIRGMIQQLATEVRDHDGINHDITTNREISRDELLKLMFDYFPSVEIENKLPEHFFIFVSDIFIFERILVNLSSNSIKHSLGIQKVSLYFEQNHLCIRVFSLATRFESFKLYLAKITNRIDIQSQGNPVYIKIFGRTGRGLSIVKRGVIKLNGKMIFSVSKRIVEVGFDLPAYIKNSDENAKALLSNKRKAIYFETEDFKRIAIEQGLQKYMISKEELGSLIVSGQRFELVTDVDLDIPENSVLKLISKKERIKGIAYNWLEELKS
jgi:hypothetical protein